jgi:thiol:disulfide interchange protein DsbC
MRQAVRWIAAGCAALIVGQVWAADAEELLRQILTRRMPTAEIGTIRRVEGLPLYEVQLDRINIMYTDGAGNYALFGDLVDLESRDNLTAMRREALRAVDFAALPLECAVVRVKGDGSRKLALFSDPDCPYCQRLEQELAKVGNVTIYLFLYPLTQLHPDAARKSANVWCSVDRAQAWDDLMLRKQLPPPAQCDTPLERIEALARSLNIEGTPGLIFGNGKLVPGVLPAPQIEELLRASAAPS